MDLRLTLLTTSILSTAALLAAQPALAQDAPTPTADDTAVDELVVTGSRIRRDEFNSVAPLQVITRDSSTIEGSINPTEILQQSSLSAGSTQLNNQFTGFVVNGGGGVNTVSLRGLGDQRTLVMLNGRRLPPGGVQGQVGAVDINSLPTAVVDRYEILKDGASSVYGSDAIAGVVNVITRPAFDGWRLEASGNIGERTKGGSEYAFSAAYGKTFDRGHITIAGDYYEQAALKAKHDKAVLCGEEYTFSPTTGERNDWIDVDTNLFKCTGPSGILFNYIPVYAATGAFYGSRASIATDGPGYPANQPIVAASNPDPNLPGFRFAPLNDRDTINRLDREIDTLSPVRRYNLYAEGTYDLGFGEAYTELMFHRRLSQQTNAQQIFPIVAPEAPCPVNPFNCAGAANVGNFYAPQVNILSLYTQRQKVDIWRGVVGLRGDFAPLDGWKYDAYVSYSYNHGRYSTTGLDDDKLLAGIGGDWTSSDFTGICPPGSPAGCYALNLFALPTLAAGNFSQADQDYLRLYDTGLTKYTQVIGEFQVTGDLFDLPAGSVGAAFGVAARYDKLNDTPGDDMLAGNFHNLASASGVTRGDDTVLEAYGELELPLLRDRTFFQDLSANLSGRVSNYDSYGTSTTYKTSLNWQIVDQLRFRATYGTSFRAPALFERFLGDQGGFQQQTVVDPCIRYAPPEGGGVANPNIAANCAAQGIPGDYAAIGSSSATIVTGGGENLEPEESKAMSLSLIWTPSFADLSVSIDYFEIEVENQVASQSTAVVGQCYASADFPNNPFCDLFTRDLDPDSTRYLEILEIDASYRNILTQTNRGIDLTVAYGRDIGPGRFGLNGQFTWTLEDTQELFPGRTDDFNNVIGEPAVVGNAQASYRLNNITVSWSTDFIGRQSNYDYQFGTDLSAPSNLTTPQGSVFRGKNHVEPMWYHHLGVAYDGGDWGMTAGVRNIFDEMPPKVSPALLDSGNFSYGKLGTYVFASQYDYVGRQFFMTLRKEF